MPNSADLVTDLPADFEVFGQAVATSMADLLGGASGYLLSKASATDMDFAWIADTTSVSPAVPWKTGSHYWPAGTKTTGAGAVNTTYYQPIIIPSTTTLTKLSVNTASTYAGTGAVRLGIYNMDANGEPSTVKLDAGTVATTAASTMYQITISQAITPGIYFLAANMQTAAATPNFVSFSAISVPTMRNNSQSNGAAAILGFSQASVTGAFATAVSPVGFTTANHISVMVTS